MKNKSIWAGLASLLFLMGAEAAPVSLETAKKTAEKFYGVQLQKAAVKSLPALSCVYPKNTKGSDFVPYYIFNAEKEQGFVIVAGDDNATSLILGYSDKGSFQTENMPDNLKFWLGFYEEGVRNAAAYNGISKPQPKSDFTKAEVVKGPLLDSINYNQDAPYNDLCPIDHTTGKRSMTGCVATALASIARYYEYPKHGQDSICYTTAKGLKLSMNFANNTYDWENMLKSYRGKQNQYTEKQRTAIATLMRDIGYAVKMGYGSDASGAFAEPTITGMVKYMGFDSIIDYRERKNYDIDDEWIAVLKDNINNGLPVYYTGYGPGGGHAFVCDGYNDDDFFHFNWGWGGLCNGYFSVHNLDPDNISGIGAGTGGGYTSGQSILHNMVPPGQNHCQDLFLLTATKFIEPNLKIDSIYSINQNTLSVNPGNLENHSMSLFQGSVALAVFQNGEFIKIISEEKQVSIAKQGSSSVPVLQTQLESLEDGEYELWVVCKPELENANWQKVYGRKASRYTDDSYIPIKKTGENFMIFSNLASVTVTVECAEYKGIIMYIHSKGEYLGQGMIYPGKPKNFDFKPGNYELRFWTLNYDTTYVNLNLTQDTSITTVVYEKRPVPYIQAILVRHNMATMQWLKEPPRGEKAYPTGFVIYLDSVEVARVSSSTTSYVYSDLELGKHQAGLRSIYKAGESEMVTRFFTISSIASANETPWNGECRIAPNPSADGYFTLEVDRDCRLQVASVSGKILMERELAAGSHAVDMSAYQAGVYLFRLSGKNGEATVLKAVIR